jgi:hypothetical protein
MTAQPDRHAATAGRAGRRLGTNRQRRTAMANPLDKFGGVGGMIRKAVPYVATYLFGRKMGERRTRKQAEEEILEQRERGDKAAQEVRDQLEQKPTGDYIRNKDI